MAIPTSGRSAFVQTLEWIRDPERFMTDRARNGPTFVARLGPGDGVVFLSDPASMKALFSGRPDQMHLGDVNGLFRRVLGRSSLLVIDGDEHMRLRKLLLPPFHGDALARNQQTMLEMAEEEVSRWPAGRSFPLQPRMQAMTLNVILAVVFGLRAGPRRDRMHTLTARLLELQTTMATTVPQLRVELGGLAPWGRLMRCTAALDEALYEEIALRRAEGGDRDDVLSLLLSARDEDGEPMSDGELRDQLITMLVAGHETTATALAWGFERLIRHPEALERLRDEVAIGETAYLDAVNKEILRLRPVLPITARKLTVDYEVGGEEYPAGTVLMACIFLLHRNPDVYDDPLAFRPERFLGVKPAAYTWLPFGGGVRRCIGAGFALAEMRAVLQTVLGRVDLIPARLADERVRRRSFTLAPSRAARAIARPRPVPIRAMEPAVAAAGERLRSAS